MRRHYQASDEHEFEQKDGFERSQQRRPQEPSDSSRDRQADPPAGASPLSIAPTMHAAKRRRTSDTNSLQSFPYQKSKSFEERNEDRSAFTSVPKMRDEKDASTAASKQEGERKRPIQDPEAAGGPIIPVASMPPPSSDMPTGPGTASALPHLSPMRYYHQQRYAESVRAKSDPFAFQYQYRGGAGNPTPPDPFGYGYPAGYYHQPQYPRPDPPSARGHLQFPFFQGYDYQQPHPYPNTMPSMAAYSQQQHLDEYYRAHHASSPTKIYTKKDPPESIKVSKESVGGGRSDPSPTQPSPPVEEDERKPAARSSSSIQESRDHVNTDLHDPFAPLPYNDIQSLFTSSLNTPSPPSPSTQVAKAAAAPHLDPFANTPKKTLAAGGTQLPQPSPVVSTAKKRRRGRHPERTTIGQSHSASPIASAASASRPSSSSKRGNTWELRYNELVSLQCTMLSVYCIFCPSY